MKVIRRITCLMLISSSAAIAQDRDWQQDYVTALSQFEQGNYEAAALALEDSISGNPQPETGGLDYLPYIYLAISRFELGQISAARDALVMSHVKAKAPTTEKGLVLINRYGKQIMQAPLNAPVLAESSEIQQAPDSKSLPQAEPLPQAKPVIQAEPEPLAEEVQLVSLSDREVETIRQQTVERCEFCAEDTDIKMPWYFHYNLGVDLMAAGDVERALESFKKSVSMRSESRRESRTYGMWYIDYLPYYQIALAYSKLGNWKNAQTAIQVSNRVGEFSPLDQDYEQFTALQSLIANNTQDSES